MTQLNKAAMQHNLHPFSNNQELINKGVRVIERGEGIYIYDTEGNKIIDGMSGLWCTNIGYGRTELSDVAKAQMDKLAYYNTFFQTSNTAVIALANKLAEVTPSQYKHVFFTGSGSESCDSMIRLVRHYWRSVGKPQKKILIGRWNGYHGSTIGGTSMGGMKSMHEQGDLPIANITHIEQPAYYELHEAGETPEAFGLKAANWLEEKILEVGADNVAAFVAEPIQGAGGVIIPPSTYWPRIQEICRQYDVLLVSDEVICGFGRTGNWFGFETFGFEPDIFTFAKGVTSGYQPLGGVMLSDRVAAGVLQGGELQHGFTYSGHPVTSAVALKNLEILQDEKIVERVRDDIAPYFQQRWQETFAPFAHADDVRGCGMIASFKVVKAKGEPFSDPARAGSLCKDIFFGNNLIFRSTVDNIICAPPLVITKAEIDEMLALAAKSLAEFEQNVVPTLLAEETATAK